MMRRSGSSPAVKRSKFAWVTWRRAASGHIAATQFGKSAAARRIALAVIKGWPEAPSSPLQGGSADGVPSGAGAACACGEVADFWPEKMLPKKFDTPLPLDDWANAPVQNKEACSSVTATMIAAVRLLTAVPVQRMLSPPLTSRFSKAPPEGPVTLSNSLTKPGFCFACFPWQGGGGNDQHHTSAFVPGCKR